MTNKGRVALAAMVALGMLTTQALALQRGSSGSIDRYAWCHDTLLDCDANIKTGCDTRYPNDPAAYKQCMSDSYDFCFEAWGSSCISADASGGAGAVTKNQTSKAH